MEEKEIDIINKKIIKTTKKIKRLEVFNAIKNLSPSIILTSSLTGITILNYDNKFLCNSYPTFLIIFTIAGCFVSIHINNEKYFIKKDKYKNDIQELINILYDEAKEEDKKMIKRK